MSGTPRCSIVIPHLTGSRPLLATLHSLVRVSIELEIVLVDNASTDGSVEEARALFPSLRVIRSASNLGYAGGANLGLEHASARWCVFLNDDAVPAPGAIESLVDRLESSPDDDLPLLQPVLRSSGVPHRFDYAGGAGGLIDRWGYPFALGRLFDQVEIDDGQYETWPVPRHSSGNWVVSRRVSSLTSRRSISAGVTGQPGGASNRSRARLFTIWVPPPFPSEDGKPTSISGTTGGPCGGTCTAPGC